MDLLFNLNSNHNTTKESVIESESLPEGLSSSHDEPVEILTAEKSLNEAISMVNLLIKY